MSNKKGFIIYNDYYEHLTLLSDAQRGRLFMALFEYAQDERLPNFDGMLKMAFSFIRAQIDRDNLKYESRCSLNKANGFKGGRPRKNNDLDMEKTDGFFENPNEAKKADTKKDNDKEKDTDTYREKEEYKRNLSKNEFSPPTLEDVKAYCLERGNKVDAEKWFDHYTSNGFMVGKNQMRDFKAAIRTWEKNEFTASPDKGGGNNKSPAYGAGGIKISDLDERSFEYMKRLKERKSELKEEGK